MSASLTVPAPMPVRLIETKLIQKGALVAVVRIAIGKMILHDTAWAAPPSKPAIGAGGMVAKGENGKTRYVPVVEFADRDSQARFSAGVISAFEAQHGPVAALAGGAR